ncbi:MAG: hypothetical protein ACLUG4_05785 [Bacilli bacterium]|jgi:hypothetical protein|nr:hypothetical protein [Staphylococcus sp.]
MNKKIVVIILIICFVLTLTGCTKRNIMKDYPSLNDKNHIYKEVKIDDVITMLKDQESFYLVMGFPECPWCQALMPVLNDVAKDASIKVVYYLYIKEIRDNEKASGHDLYLELENNYFKEALDSSNNRLNAPTFVKVDNGIMTKYHLNTTQDHIKNENGVLPPLTQEQRGELENILMDFFK